MNSEVKMAQKFGNGAHIVIPKSYLGKQVIIQAVPLTFEKIQTGIIDLLHPYLPNIVGIYLYGSYVRNEQTVDSDIDILVVTNERCSIPRRHGIYSIVSTTLKELESTTKENPILILPILHEAKAIINPALLLAYKDRVLSKKNTNSFLSQTSQALSFVKKGFELDFELGSLVYSLVLRIRALYIITCILKNKPYTKSKLFSFLQTGGFSQKTVFALYHVYSQERDGVKVIEDKNIDKQDILRLITLIEKLLKKVHRILK